ncbi:MAG: bifunctional phosphopantothenoylcysteine decarboxylase/phosphopantothenate--cysteine ligase CoaBC [Chitinivibrionales bacterium]|nr:bifunctional phosphopantothenoylcysteine decarboxylase/phosphopantothenate--cysteine ligase CoaBC [Chitinivibrionales bacterium]
MSENIRIALGVCGGIAAYKIPQLVRLFRKEHSEVRAVLTPNARGFVGEEALRTVTENPVLFDLSPSQNKSTYLYPGRLDHIDLGRWADYLLICPATANTIAKLACGIADNLLTTVALTFAPEHIIIAPAMNSAMWRNPVNLQNVARLKERGVEVLPVDDGELACGDDGPGRMLPVEDIVEYVISCSVPRSLTGKKVLISSGPTVEPVDPVRVLTNRSSGKMGAALARAARGMGAQVTVVTGPSQEPLPAGIRKIPVRTAAEMKDTLESEFDAVDICIMAAAVSDYRIEKTEKQKIKRDKNETLTLNLVPNPDILQLLGKKKKKQLLVGFALESDIDEQGGGAKMKKKNCDIMICNQVETSLEKDCTQICILKKGCAPEYLPEMEKSKAAGAIIVGIAEYLGLTDD